jgi:hypothetical protein
MKKSSLCLIIIFLVTSMSLYAQDDQKEKVSETFSGLHILNGHSTEMLKSRQWRYIIAHRFGDFGGAAGGVQSGFGFDNAADIKFGFDLGLSDQWMVGLSRLKGAATPYKSIIESFTKYRFLEQTKAKGIPISMAIVGTMYYTYMPASSDVTSITSFPKDIHRFNYATQLVITRKFHPRISLALLPTYVHRNLVDYFDQNSLFSLGGAASIKITKSLGITSEYFYNFNQAELRDEYINCLSFGLDWKTNGHNFSFIFTNARGLGELQYIALNNSDWLAGQFRFGFEITRTFKY